MITNKEALKVVYNIVYNSTYFSIRELKDLGLSKSQIDRFVGFGILDTQVADRSKQLFKLGCALSYPRMHEYALNCFDKSSDMALRNKELQEQIFSNSLFCGNLNRSFNYFTKAYDSSNTIHNMYLYLMNMGMDLPKEYQEVVDTLDITDMSEYANGSNDGKNNIRQNIVKCVFDRDISYAYGLIKRLGSDESVKDLASNDKSVLYLLKYAKRYQKSLALSAYKMLLDNNYSEFVQLFDSLENNRKLSYHNSLILKLAKAKINLENGREIYSLGYDMENPIDVMLSEGKYSEMVGLINKRNITAEEYIRVMNKEVEDINKLNKKDSEAVVASSEVEKTSSGIEESIDVWLRDKPVWKTKEGRVLDQALFVGPYAVTMTKKYKK